MPWWGQFGSDELCAVVMERDGKAIGFLPFYVYEDPAARKRQLLPLGVGTTDYLDGIFAQECTTEEIGEAVEFLLDQVEHDEFCATQLPGKSRLLAAVQKRSEIREQRAENRDHGAESREPGASGEGRIFVSEAEGCSRMAAVRMAELPQKIRRNAMYYRNRAQRGGTLELVEADASNWKQIFEELRRLHRERWQTRGEDGVLVDERVVEWHREAIPLLLRAGLVRLMALRLNDEVIAVLYSLIDPVRAGADGRTQFFYITAYSPEHAELRPGTLLIAFAVERAANEGVATIDMLRGDEGYKQIWHMVKTPTFCVTRVASGRREERAEQSAA